jgi:hypothetical protein
VAVVNILGVLAGVGWYALVVSVGGGGGLLVMAAVMYRRMHRAAS